MAAMANVEEQSAGGVLLHEVRVAAASAKNDAAIIAQQALEFSQTVDGLEGRLDEMEKRIAASEKNTVAMIETKFESLEAKLLECFAAAATGMRGSARRGGRGRGGRGRGRTTKTTEQRSASP